MEFSNDPEINCVFCGIGFNSVENVEFHIQSSHQSNNADHLETRKLSNTAEEFNTESVQRISNITKIIKPSQSNGLKSDIVKGNTGPTKFHKAKCLVQSNQIKYLTSETSKSRNNKIPSDVSIEKAWKTRAPRSKIKHQCYRCSKRFLYQSTLWNHLQNHQVKDKCALRCDKCGSKFSTRQILLRHSIKGCVLSILPDSSSIKEEHSESGCCRYCQTTFTSSAILEIHQRRVCHAAGQIPFRNGPRHLLIPDARSQRMARKHDRTLLICDRSKDNTIDDDLLGSHSTEILSTQGSQTSETPKYHSNSPHLSPKDSISSISLDNDAHNKADIAEETAKDKDQQYHWHNYNGKTGHQKPFHCEICKKDFSNRSSLSNHIKSHYSSRGQPFICRDCNQRFVNLITLQDHRREVCSQKTAESKSPVEEDLKFRPKPVYSLSNFNGVSQVPLWPNSNQNNSGSQPVTCVHCDGVFYDRLELEEHALTKHSDELGNILCLLCERTFTTNMALRVHLTKSHGFANGGCPGVSQNLPPMPRLDSNYNISDDIPHRKRRRRLFEYEKEYTCENCHRNFSTGQALGNHRRACMNMPNDVISIENKPNHSNQNSKMHSIESLIFDNKAIRSASFKDDKNVFLAFN